MDMRENYNGQMTEEKKVPENYAAYLTTKKVFENLQQTVIFNVTKRKEK